MPLKALGIRKDDTFSTTMLGYALEKLAEEVVDNDSEYRGCLMFFIDVNGSEIKIHLYI